MIIHAGDCANSRHLQVNQKETEDFLDWYSSLNIKHKILVPGNHCIHLERDRTVPDNVTLLINDSCIIEGIKIFGSPYTPSFGGDWAFIRKRHKMNEVWDHLKQFLILLLILILMN
jgi:hypothetical protein